MSLARDTPYFRDRWQSNAYGVGGYATYKEVTAKVREHASEILTVQQNGDSKVQTVWMCTARCCATKGRWCGKKDKFNQHRKQHAGGDASFVDSPQSKEQSETRLLFSVSISTNEANDISRHEETSGVCGHTRLVCCQKGRGWVDSREGVCVSVCSKGGEEVG